VDYPKPIVDHDAASKENMSKMKAAYDAHKAKTGDDQDGDDGACRRPATLPIKTLLSVKIRRSRQHRSESIDTDFELK
jgi:hypothetical protein